MFLKDDVTCDFVYAAQGGTNEVIIYDKNKLTSIFCFDE